MTLKSITNFRLDNVKLTFEETINFEDHYDEENYFHNFGNDRADGAPLTAVKRRDRIIARWIRISKW